MDSQPPGAVDVCLIPEVVFTLDKLYAYVEQVLDRQGYAVVCVAEGAGQVSTGCLVLSHCCVSSSNAHQSVSLTYLLRVATWLIVLLWDLY